MIQLRREVPGRSVRSIIQILEWEGKIEPGAVRRSALSGGIAEAFLRVEKRKVDKLGCVSFSGKKYEIESGLLLIGRSVDVIYDPSDVRTVWIEHEGFSRSKAKPLSI